MVAEYDPGSYSGTPRGERIEQFSCIGPFRKFYPQEEPSLRPGDASACWERPIERGVVVFRMKRQLHAHQPAVSFEPVARQVLGYYLLGEQWTGDRFQKSSLFDLWLHFSRDRPSNSK